MGSSSENCQSFVAIYNTTRDCLETIVQRKNSTLIQHEQAFNSFVRVCGEKGLKVSGEVKNHGGQVIVEALFNNLSVADGSEGGLKLGVRLENNYDHKGYPNFGGSGFAERLVCSNGMVMKEIVAAIFNKHNKVADLDKVMLEFVDNVLNKSVEALKELVHMAKADGFDDEDELNSVLAGELNFSKRIAKKVKHLIDKEDPTRYGLYNALTNYATHEAPSERMRMRMQRIAERVLVKPKIELKTDTWEG